MKDRFWKTLACALLALTLCAGMLAACTYNHNTAGSEAFDIVAFDAIQSARPDILRLHILANSDSPADQNVKLKVRDALAAALRPADTMQDAQMRLLTDGGELLELTERILRENGFAYGAQLMLGDFHFPDRTYGSSFYPAGNYRALRVVLGEGAGQNWWCVLFPPLCIVEEGSEPLPEGEGIVFESTIVNWLKGR